MANPQERIRLLEKQLQQSQSRLHRLKEINGNALGWLNTGHSEDAKKALQEGQRV